MTLLHRIKTFVNANVLLKRLYGGFKAVITVVPFYLFREKSTDKRKNNILPTMDLHDLEVGRLGAGDMEAIAASPGVKFTEAELLKRLEDGCMCLGIKYRSRVIAWFWSYPHACDTPLFYFPLKEKEAYVTGLWTIQEFRGRNLAPYLRQRFYQYHFDRGYETIYAIMEYFNKPALAYEKRLGFQPLSLYLHFILFKKYRFTIRIRQYDETAAS